MKTIKEKAHEATIKYLQNKGYEIIQDGFEFPGFSVDIVAKDDNDIVFIKTKIREDRKLKDYKPLTNEEHRNFVSMSIAFLDIHDDLSNCNVRLDNITLFILNNERALIEHYINAESNI